jgi:signal transduction histidine kinase
MLRPLRHRPWPLRRQLGLLLLGTVLPLLVFSALLVTQLAREVQRDVERRLLFSARTMSAHLEREVQDVVDVLERLARSERLAAGDLEGFREEALQVRALHPAWQTLILLDPTGAQRVNLSWSGAALPTAPAEEGSFRRVLAEDRPVLGALARGRDGRGWGFPVRVPVRTAGGARWVLTAVVTPDVLQQLLHVGAPAEGDEELTRTVVDSNGAVVFRGRNSQAYLGARATADFLEGTRGRAAGVFRSTTLDGIPSYVAFTRSERHGWVSAVVVPRALVDGPLRRSLLALGAFGAAALAASVGWAVLLSRRFRAGVTALETAGQQLAAGVAPRVAPTGVEELDRLAASLSASAGVLHERTRALEEAVRARDEFLSLASHELKTPLTTLQLHAQLAGRALGAEGEEAHPAARRFLGQAQRQTGRLGRLVDDMLDISRLATGRMALAPETFELGAFAQEVAGRLEPLLAGAGCALTVRVESPAWGTWDRSRLEQALGNLLTNAARYGAGRPVEVQVGRAGETARLAVRDGGRGLAPGDLERVFGKFERAVDGSEVSGLGLGLYITREIVSRHGGTVHAESAPGAGATFVITLPCLAAAPQEERQTA